MAKKEKMEYEDSNKIFPNVLYPTLNDANFNIKIAKRKEFFTTQYDGKIYDVKKQADILCNAEFELLPHQLFVKNFLSFQTPYNGLLLYHGLGTGKTCSAIGIAEEMRNYMKQVGIKQRILIIASPNVQANFRLQLFDERKLKKVPNPNQTVGISNSEEDVWNIDSCIGNSLLKEINPTNLKGLSREKIISQINTIINNYYVFMGYGQLANYISDKIKVDEKTGYSEKERNEIEIKNIKQIFNNRLIIIDEVHNIRLTDENNNKKTAVLLMKLAKHAENMRLLFLSATPMFNSYKEIIWLTNLLNLNDKRSIIEISDVFDKNGNFRQGKLNPDGKYTENGRNLLKRKLTGYISYVRGENPYTFPFRIYPNNFSIENTFTSKPYPTIQMNGKTIDDPLKHINVYVNDIGDYQGEVYSTMIENLRKKSYDYYNVYGEMREMPTFENMESFGYTLLQSPLSSLNIVYPNQELDKLLGSRDKSNTTPDFIKEETNILINSIGLQGLKNIMTWDESYKPQPIRHNFEYKPNTLKKYGAIFDKENIAKYSSKISNICEIIRNSKGIVIIYSQFIDGGILPLALALEEMGMTRYCSQDSHNKPLFKKKRGEQVDSQTFKIRSETIADGEEFNPARYIMITGDKTFSPSNAQDIKIATNSDNKNGEKIKVVLISKAGSEGLDFKNIRQVHVLEPWYNMNRIEQIIGRGVRNLSHCQLPFEERNVEIYLHCTLLKSNEEAADLYVYRLAEKKALQIGKVTRLLKETSVDCLLNISQTNFSAEKILQLAENQNIKINLSSGKTIIFKIGDQPFTDICDYMDNCEYKCSPSSEIKEEDIIQETYNDDFIISNRERIIERIRNLFREHIFYRRDVLIRAINIVKQYPIEQIFYALTYLIQNKNEYLFDKYGRQGNLVNKGEYYIFQPIEISDENISIFERVTPIDSKREHYYLELPSKIEKEEIKKREHKKKQENEKEEIPSELTSFESIIEKIRNNLNIVFSKEQIFIGTGEKNRYKHANHVIGHIENVYSISRTNIEKYMIDHMLDMLLLPEKMILIKELYNQRKQEMNTDILIHIENYFNKRIMKEGGKTAIILNKENGWKIFMKPEDDEGSEDWEEGEPEDYKLFDRKLDEYVLDDDKINNIVGFVNMFKGREMVFKIKDVRQARNNTGARCGDSTTKADAIKLLNMLLEKNVYDDSTEIMHFGLCVIIEILMRHYTAIKKNNRIYFLTPEETAVNDIVKYSR